jgi:uncharacterized membrane protein YdjX (TVP38/TMEM64 family)
MGRGNLDSSHVARERRSGPARMNGTAGAQPSRRSRSLGRIVPIAVLAAGLVLFVALDLDRYVSLDGLRGHRSELTDWVARNGVAAGVVFAAAYAIAVACSIPGGALLTIAGGFLFGPYAATAYVVCGATLGATALFLAARFALTGFLKGRVGGALAKMAAGFNENPLSYLLILRLVPLFPFWLVNIVPALLGVRTSTYVIGTFFGIIPGTFVFALVGDGAGAVLDAGKDLDLDIIYKPRFVAPIIGLAVLATVPIAYRRLRSRRRRGGGDAAGT